MTERSPTFCIKPWIHMATYTSGEALMCCVAKQSAGNLNKNTIEEIWNGEHYRKARLAMLAGQEFKACSRCYNEEKAGLDSHRKIENIIWEYGTPLSPNPSLGTKAIDALINNTDENGYITDPPITFDLRLGNTCNLKCVMCGPKDSSMWVNFARELGQDMSQWDTSVFNWVENDDFWNKQFMPLLPNIKHLILAGGEPLLLKQHRQLLERCIKEGYSKNITIRYHTNGTIIPDYLYDLWKEFNFIDLLLSIDCWEEKNNYIRYPSDWNNILDNLHVLDNSGENIAPRMLTTVNAYNIFYVPDFANWILSQNFNKINKHLSGDPVGLFSVGLVHGPHYLNVKLFPNYIKEAITDKYNDWHNSFSKEYQRSYKVERICSVVDFMNSDDWSRHFKKFKNYTVKIDRIRGTSFEKVFPELAEMIQ